MATARAVLARHLDGSPGSDDLAPLAVGFSGGSDSLAALLVALDLAEAQGRQVLALTVDHQIQSASRAWTVQCAALARQLGAVPVSLVWDGPKPDRGLPAAARQARHRLLACAARDHGAQVLILGHTADDGREADWMRAGGSTLGQLHPWVPSPVWPEGRDVFVLRPLLTLDRAALRLELCRRGLSWIEDPANTDPHYARPRARRALAEGAGSGDGLSVAARSEARFWPDALGPWTALGALVLRRQDFGHEGSGAFLARALVCVAGTDRLPRGDRVQRLRAALAGTEPHDATLAGTQICAHEDRVWIWRDRGRAGLPVLDLAAGETAVWDGRFLVRGPDHPVQVRALQGLARGLTPPDQRRLKAVPARLRATLPVFVATDGQVRLPAFVSGPAQGPSVAHCLVLARLAAACGRIIAESGIRPAP
jgi:tRNA(Ile)-lysidine synthase